MIPAGNTNRTHIAKKPELLAPAGTKEAFQAALENGADAVYLGLKAFSARALARNFSLSEVGAMVDLAHGAGQKVFVALNSLIKEQEIRELVEDLAALESIGADAIIIQDLGLWRIARTHFPGLRLHASTLMTIHNSLGVRQAHSMGFNRVVLAREMTLEEVRSAVRDTPIETEVFVHGALCFSYSGLCLFSSYFGGKSSTRGRCVQPCRRRYSWGGKTGTFFSMGDLCSLECVHELWELGVRSIKIEGRLRPPHYVASVVRAYRMVLDSPRGDPDALAEARRLVEGALGRPLTKGYYFAAHPADAITPGRTANTGRYLGKILDSTARGLLLSAETPPEKGDRLRLIYRDKDHQRAFLCRDVTKDTAAGAFWLTAGPIDKEAKGALLFKVDPARSQVLSSSGGSAARRSSTPEKAGVRAAGHIRRLIKNSRQKAERVLREIENPRAEKNAGPGERNPRLFVKLADARLVPSLRGLQIHGIILDITRENLLLFRRRQPGWAEHTDVVWSLPPIIHEGRLSFFAGALGALRKKGFRKFQVANLGELALFKAADAKKFPRKHKQIELWGSYTLNILNSQALQAARDLGLSMPQFSIESDQSNAKKATAHVPGLSAAFTVFGYMPLFVTRMDHPVYRPRLEVTSPKGERFRWQRSGDCGLLLPERPLSLMSRRNELQSIGFSTWIIDLSNWPRSKPLPKGLTKGHGPLATVLHGKDFNFLTKLE
jgi:putative protease